jgi:hypothetical protein
MVLCTSFARRSTGYNACLKVLPRYLPQPSAIHGSNSKGCAIPGSWHRVVLTNLVRCCSAFAYTSTTPTSLDSSCLALGRKLGASHNGHSPLLWADARPYSTATTITNALLPAARRFGVLRGACIGCWHRPQPALPIATARVLASQTTGTDHPRRKKRGKSVQNSPSTAYGFLIPVRKAGLPF